ncbi:MAG: Fur family transcriptional regulator [Thermoanaerobaculales bacterium]
MDEAVKKQRVEDFKRLCRKGGERFTVQRRIILEAVLDLDNHPSADQVFDVVAAREPGIARTTVYRTLEHLSRLGVITKACHPGRVARFDARTELHHHLVCLRCNDFIDLDHDAFDGLTMPDTSAFGFEAFDYRVQVRGTCRSCLRMEESK